MAFAKLAIAAYESVPKRKGKLLRHRELVPLLPPPLLPQRKG